MNKYCFKNTKKQNNILKKKCMYTCMEITILLKYLKFR